MARQPRLDIPGVPQHIVQRGVDRHACFGGADDYLRCVLQSAPSADWHFVESRFKASLIDTDRYLLTCYRYIELNPVRAGMVAAAAQYRWSSHRRNAQGESDFLITPHSSYLTMGHDADARQVAYRQLFDHALDRDAIDDIRAHLQQQKVWGSERFQAQVEALAGRAACVRPRGRPWPGREAGK